jgi:hypothetical protein
MSNPSRRTFVMTLIASGGTLAAAGARAQANAPVLSETDPQAVALGYKADASKVDAAKYPTHVAGAVCGGCNFFQGKAGAAQGPCQLFAGKQVSAKGWCSGYAKKAA